MWHLGGRTARKEEEGDCVDQLFNQKYKGSKIEIVEILNSKCFFSNAQADLKEVLAWAIKRKYKEISNQIIGLGSDPTTREYENMKTILSIAAVNRDLEMVEYLILN